MKKHSEEFKTAINRFGRELDSKLTFGETELSNEQLNAVTPVLQSSLLKSVMKELDIDSNVDIPIGTIVNYKFGVLLDSGDYEYLDYGNYIVYSSEKQEDTNSYNIVAYDVMLNSMKEYTTLKSKEILSKEFPMSVRDYLTCLCTDIGLVFASSNEEFANWDKMIEADPYENLQYTYRDILDELAQVTASNIIINDKDQVAIKYIVDTEDTIDEEYLKDINVAFGKKYGPINSIVLSRSAGADNVYLQDEQSVADNGLCELKISDNQIMNGNDRSDYLPAILEKLNGLEYYINDFSSTGICYYEVADRYNVTIGENTYSCIMFNDEIDITQGLEETIHTDLPEQAETDYTKADKTDRKINQTYLIVDKQNQKIESVVSQTDGFNERITKAEQTVDGFRQTVDDLQQIIDEGGFVDEQRLQSAITQSAGQIEASVSQQITDAEGNIKQDVNGQLNLYIKKGATGDVVSAFNLASDEVEIHSTNFNLETNGKLECTGAKINNGKLYISKQESGGIYTDDYDIEITTTEGSAVDYAMRINAYNVYNHIGIGAVSDSKNYFGVLFDSAGRATSYGATFYTQSYSSELYETEIKASGISTNQVTIKKAPVNSTDAVRLQDLDNNNYAKIQVKQLYSDVPSAGGRGKLADAGDEIQISDYFDNWDFLYVEFGTRVWGYGVATQIFKKISGWSDSNNYNASSTYVMSVPKYEMDGMIGMRFCIYGRDKLRVLETYNQGDYDNHMYVKYIWGIKVNNIIS